jgi:hypothetical protein
MNAASRPDVLRALTLALALLGIPCLAADALAQGGWNRRLEAVAVTENATLPGTYDIHVVFEVHTDGGSTVPNNIGTSVDVNVDGLLVSSHTIPIGSDPGSGGCVDAAACGSGCGSGTVDGGTVGLLCVADGPCSPICDCKCTFPPITSTAPQNSMFVGDEITVILYPAPGAVPDVDASDNQITYAFQGEPVFWNREIASISLTEVPTGPDVYDVAVDGMVFHDGLLNFLPAGEGAELDFELELHVNGVHVSTNATPFQPVPLGLACTCGNACATWDGTTHDCLSTIPSGCACGWPWRSVFPGVSLVTGDEVVVLLRPAPGALPELPGFGDDDLDGLVCCPGPTGAEVVAGVAAQPLRNRPNPFSGGTEISFEVHSGAPIRLEVFDLRGRKLRTLIDGAVYGPGSRGTASWDGRTMNGDPAAAGIYFCRLTADGRTHTRKMTLAR